MTRTALITMFILCSIVSSLVAQSEKKFYVNSTKLNLRETAGDEGKVLKSLEKYDNVVLLDSVSESGWVKVKYKEIEGHVVFKLLAKGEAVVTIQSVRVGAFCKDGTTSRATGRGACSHHGGVRRWRYENRKNVSIINNQP